MASTRSTSFERSLDQFRRELSDDQKKEFSGANQKYINSMLQDMQVKLGREKGLCRLTRIEKFLSAMKHIEALVTVFLNVHEVVAMVWGPIKLALMVATTWTDSVKQLLDAYQEIGEVLGNLAFFHELIKSSEYHREIVEYYFSDILRFHSCVLNVFSRPDFKRYFNLAWGSFRHKIKPIIDSLKRRQDILSDDKLQSHAIFKEVKDSGSYAKDQFKNLQAGLEDIRTAFETDQLRSKASQNREMKAFLEDKLGVPGFRADSQLAPSEQSVKSSGSWIISHTTFRSWEDEKPLEGSVLFLNGSPGAGKSTLARTVIRHLKGEQAHKLQSLNCLAYFFFKHDDADRRTTRSMLCHIIAQLINSDETIMRLAHEKCSSVDQIEFSDLKNLAQDCLAAHRNAYLVLDGLDEAIDTEPEVSLQWCLEELLPAVSRCGCHLKLLICGQRDGRLDLRMTSYPQLRLDTIASHNKDIEEYSKCQAAEIRARFSLTQQEEQGMLTKITSASQGMFLYAKVVLANLASMDSVEEFEDEMQSDKFPANLEQAYDRITQRVLKQAGPSRQKTVKKILGWIICSKRPLRWREIQSRFCINVDNGTCNARSRRVDSCKRICGSLVDITICNWFRDDESEQIVNMVHETASKYLVHNGTINLLQEHADMALFCCRYLSSWPFSKAQESDSFRDVFQSGYFGFLDYASAHYLFHVQESKPLLESKAAVEAAMVDLLDAHHVETSNQLNSSAWMDRLHKEEQNTLDLAIQSCVVTIREVLERRPEDFSLYDTFLSFCGQMRFKCPKIHCTMFSAGFLTQNDRDMHLAIHERPFRCTYTDCFAHTTGYVTYESLQAHDKSIHQDDSDLGVLFPATAGNKKWDILEACKKGNLAEVERFYFTGDNPNKNQKGTRITPFSMAAQAGHGHICKFFMDQGISPYESINHASGDWSPMAEAIRQQNVQIIELILHSRFSLQGKNSRSRFACYIAIAILYDHQEGLEHLLRAKTSLEHAKMFKDVARLLIEEHQRKYRPIESNQGHTIDATLMKLWFRRAFPHLTHDAGMESRAGAFIKRPDSSEYQGHKAFLATFLHRAFGIRCYPFSAFLMDLINKDDLQGTDNEGLTPLHHLAAGYRYCRSLNCESCFIMTKRIIETDGGVSANTADNSGMLPAQHAMRVGSEKSEKPPALRILFSYTRNPNHKDNDGDSLLHYAIKSPGLLRTFLENKGIKLLVRNRAGQTAFSASFLSTFGSPMGVLEALIEADRALAWTADDTQLRLTPLHYTFRTKSEEKHFVVVSRQTIQQQDVAKFLLSIPEVEYVLRAYLESPGKNHPEEVRKFARQNNLQAALKVMDRIGF